MRKDKCNNEKNDMMQGQLIIIKTGDIPLVLTRQCKSWVCWMCVLCALLSLDKSCVIVVDTAGLDPLYPV